MKKLFQFIKKNYFLLFFALIIFFVLLVSAYRTYIVKPTYIYTKVKIGQGLWWASTIKPSNWLIQSLKKGMKEKDLTGKILAEILSVRYYPWIGLNQYDIYLTIKLKVTGNGKNSSYSFNRTSVGIGGPIDFEFPEAQFSGTIIALSKVPFEEKYEEKIIYLFNQDGLPFEYGAIRIGDFYFDGQDKVFEILDKSFGGNYQITSLKTGDLLQAQSLTVKAKIKVKKEGNRYIFGEEQLVIPGNMLNIATNNFHFSNYITSGIE